MLTSADSVAETGLDAAAVKPAECDVSLAAEMPFETVTIDYEGQEHLPDAETLADLASDKEVLVTVPVRADGFDPLGDDHLLASLPDGVGHVVVAGHPAYLTAAERRRSVAPRIRAGVDRAPGAWVGTEGIERVALATGATQFELLSGTAERDLRSLRSAGYEGELAVYAPTVLAADEDAILDAVGAYVARRGPVAHALPDDAPTDSAATGRAREVLLTASHDYALVGTPPEVATRVRALGDAGADRVVGYPADGIEQFVG
jgi:hypothetical protein